MAYSDGTFIEITGIEECCELFEQAPRQAVPRALLAGLTAGGRVLEAAIAARAPVASVTRWNPETFSEFEDTTGHGTLLADLDTTVTLDSEFRGGIAEVGFADLGYVARFVEYGHRQFTHWENKAGYIDSKGRKRVKKWGGHQEIGEVEAHPFMRPAADTAQEAAVDAFVDAAMELLIASGLVDEAAA